jgi:hypothetical protein
MQLINFCHLVCTLLKNVGTFGLSNNDVKAPKKERKKKKNKQAKCLSCKKCNDVANKIHRY